MGWILIEGLDRSGKSSLAEDYRKKGYIVHHMEAPSKKYYQEGYAGESYLEELVRLYSKYDGQNVLFDRTIYGELVWPNVYGRLPLLEQEDIDYLAQIERNNSAEKILMFDANTEAHWQRCVANNEPLTRQQFGRASIFYERLAKEFGFSKKQLSDFPALLPQDKQAEIAKSAQNTQSSVQSLQGNDGNASGSGTPNGATAMGEKARKSAVMDVVDAEPTLEERLELANTIREVLQSKILKKKGGSYDNLEKDIKGFLEEKLQECFSGKKEEASFSNDEVMILKSMAKRIKEKM